MTRSRARAPRVLVTLALLCACVLGGAVGAGAAADTTVPVLTSVSVSDTTLSAGETVSISYTATDDAASLSCIALSFRDPAGGGHVVRSEGTVPLSGTLTAAVGSDWPAGVSELVEVTLCDPSANTIRYRRGGTTIKVPFDATGPGTHAFDLAASDLVVGDVPTAPTSVTAIASDKSASVSWSPPADSGGGPVTGYTIRSSPGGVTRTVGNVSSATVTGLTNGTTYTFTVVATNAIGTGPASAPSNAVIPPAPPSPPTGVTAVRGAASATVSWTAPPSNGGGAITGYTITGTPGDVTRTVAGTQTSAVVNGLTNGTAYTFTVVATNAIGSSPASAPSNAVTPATVPGAPTAVIGSAADDAAHVSWTASPANGSPVTQYVVTASPGGATATVAGDRTSGTVTGLVNGTGYTFTVVATNALGSSPTSAASNAVTPAPVPGAPNNVTAARGDKSATVGWTAPSSSGGSAITGYTITSTPGGITKTVASDQTTGLVSGLTNGTSYTFTVIARNAAGASPPSDPSSPVVPATVPGTPATVTATKGDASATVSWNAPGSNGGSPITTYTVTSSPGGVTTTVAGDVTTSTLTGLVNGTAYTFTVVATNAIGASAPAKSGTVTPSAVAGAPTAVTATRGDKSAVVSWTAPTSNGGSPITGYTITSTPGAITKTVTGALTTGTVTGLTNGTAYTFTVVATNAAGTSPASLPSNDVTPAAVPGAPGTVTAVKGDASATVSWTAPASSGGSALTGYTITSTPGGLVKTVASELTTATVTGLTNGTAYTFSVVATNAVGSSPAAKSGTVTPATTPGAPTLVTAVKGDKSAVVSWTAPSSNGGTAITGYTITSTPGGLVKAVAGTVTTGTVTGLTNGTAYTFTVVATNASGTSPASLPSDAVVPAAVPGAPTAVAATRGDTTATVSWAAPATNGSPVTSYTLTGTPGGVTRTVPGDVTSTTVTGLTNGTSYTFTVTATNAVGTSPASAPSNAVTPVAGADADPVPLAPSGFTAQVQGKKLVLSWAAPAAGEPPVTRYRLTSNKGLDKALGPGKTRLVLRGITPGRYIFVLLASNEVGDSLPIRSKVRVRSQTTTDVPAPV